MEYDLDIYGDLDDEEEDAEMPRMYTMVVKVLGSEGEENMSIAQVSDYDMEVLNPMLLDIRSRNGYYPSGKYLRPGNPTPRDLYRKYPGWEIFQSIIPHPLSGFSHITEIELYEGEPLKMTMIHGGR